MALWGAPATAGETRTITVQGTGSSSVPPDMVEISAGTVSRAQRAATALAENNEKVARLLALVAESGIAEQDVRTKAFSVNPIFEAGGDGSKPLAIVGYEVSNAVSITLRDTETLGAFLDKLTSAGVNGIRGVRFGVSDCDELLQAIRRAAVSDARARATLYADEAGVALGRVISLAEGGASSSPRELMDAPILKGSFAVPVAPGSIDFQATVTMRFAIEPD